MNLANSHSPVMFGGNYTLILTEVFTGLGNNETHKRLNIYKILVRGDHCYRRKIGLALSRPEIQEII